MKIIQKVWFLSLLVQSNQIRGYVYHKCLTSREANDKAEFQAARLDWLGTQSKQTQQVWWSLNDTLIHGMISTNFYDPIWCIWCFCVLFNDSSQVVPISMLWGPQDSTITPCRVSAQCAGARKVLRPSSVSALAALRVREAAFLHGPPVQTERKLGCPELHQTKDIQTPRRYNLQFQKQPRKLDLSRFVQSILQALSLVRF